MKGRKNTIKRMAKLAAALLLPICMLTGCADATLHTVMLTNKAGINNTAYTQEEPPAEPAARTAGIYDSEDAAVVVKKDMEAQTIQLQNISTSRRYTLNYDGTTVLYDRNGQPLSMQQLKEGSIATVRFYKEDKSLVYVKENPDCVSYTNTQNYSMDLKNGTITIGNEQYHISGHVVVSSGGRETDMMEVNQVDVISAWGYRDMIYGINVEKGHGYLRLQNEDYFVGGWIDVSDKVIRKVSEDMLLVVPEGTYDVTVSHRGSSATQEISFARNEEMAWDLGEVEITVVQRGNIIFTLTPATAKVSVDGREVNVSKPVTLEYGLHRMRISADGYETVAQYIKVAEPSANISVELEESEKETEGPSAEESSEEASSESKKGSSGDDGGEVKTTSKKYASNAGHGDDGEESEEETGDSSGTEGSTKNPAASASGKYKVYIDAPEGVEAYLDGNYIGVTPVNFGKKQGSYVVTLRKNGYQPRSYTLQIDSEEKDVNYSFTELIRIAE